MFLLMVISFASFSANAGLIRVDVDFSAENFWADVPFFIVNGRDTTPPTDDLVGSFGFTIEDPASLDSTSLGGLDITPIDVSFNILGFGYSILNTLINVEIENGEITMLHFGGIMDVNDEITSWGSGIDDFYLSLETTTAANPAPFSWITYSTPDSDFSYTTFEVSSTVSYGDDTANVPEPATLFSVIFALISLLTFRKFKAN
ncbi:PEP-CTERM sorting domain-containing protein [bacterium]|nr:PEP-CTERM sorting domain-containing protein [bacterium]